VKRIALPMVAVLAGCDGGKGTEPLCEYSTPTGFSDDTYAFHDTNFACEGLPSKESFRVNGTSFSDFFSSATALTSLSDSQVEDAIDSALASWNRIPAGVNLSAEVKSSGVVKDDEDNVIVMETLSEYELTPARAYRYIYKESNVSCDIEIYTSYRPTPSAGGTVIRWAVTDPAPSDGLRLEDTFAHEFGHCLGLDHPRSNHDDSIMKSWWFRHSARSLSVTDIEALKFLYPL